MSDSARTADVAAGDRVLVRTADRKLLEKTAITPVINGRDFPVVWCVWDHEYDLAKAAEWERLASDATFHRKDELPGVPWPAEDVIPRA